MKKLIFVLTMLLTISFVAVSMAAGSCNCMRNKETVCTVRPCVDKIESKCIELVVDTVELSADGKYVTVFSDKQDLIATIDKRACKQYKEIKEGSKLRLWYKFMTMSLPAKTNAVKAEIMD